MFRIFSSKSDVKSEVKSEMSDEAAEAAEELSLTSIVDRTESHFCLLPTSLSQNSLYLTYSLPSFLPDGEFFSCQMMLLKRGGRLEDSGQNLNARFKL